MIPNPVVILFAIASAVLISRGIQYHRKRSGKVPVNPDRALYYAMQLPSESRATFLLCTFSLLAKVAKADDGVGDAEVSRMERYIQEKLKLTDKYRAVALTIFHEGVESPLDYREYVEIFRKTFPDRIQLFATLVDTLLEIATADGKLDIREEELIRSIALLLDCSEPYFEKRKQEYLGYH
jgi:uncharacterized tellurite resistance protein B-like protein